MPAPKFTLYSKPEYFADIIKRLKKAGPGDRVLSATMDLETGPDVRPVLDAFVEAATLGADVTLLVDAHDILDHNSLRLGPLFVPFRAPGYRGGANRPLIAALNGLKAAGGRYAITNQPASLLQANPVKGRSHIKLTLINDYIYVGGCNLENYTRLDMMAGWEDATVSAKLASLGQKIAKSGHVQAALPDGDLILPLTDTATILVDAGVPKRSLIYDHALELIESAREHVFMACQLFPGGSTGRALLAAQLRGAKVTIAYNHPSLMQMPDRPLHYLYAMAERRHLPKSFFAGAFRGPRYIHAKLIATEQGAIMGSHNFVEQGVNFGTAELALLVRNPEFAQRATQKVLTQLSQ